MEWNVKFIQIPVFSSNYVLYFDINNSKTLFCTKCPLFLTFFTGGVEVLLSSLALEFNIVVFASMFCILSQVRPARSQPDDPARPQPN